MARIDKRIERMRNAPNGVSPDELDGILGKLGFSRKHGKGDHRRYDHDALAYSLTIDPRRPLLPAAVKAALAAIDEVLAIPEEDTE